MHMCAIVCSQKHLFMSHFRPNPSAFVQFSILYYDCCPLYSDKGPKNGSLERCHRTTFGSLKQWLSNRPLGGTYFYCIPVLQVRLGQKTGQYGAS